MLAAASALGLASTSGVGLGEREVLRWNDAAAGAELPHARGGAAATVWTHASQRVLYEFGGCSEVKCYDDLNRLDTTKGRWAVERAAGKPPTRRKGHTLTLLGPNWICYPLSTQCHSQNSHRHHKPQNPSQH